MIAKYYLVDSRRDEKSPDYQNSILFEKYLNDQGLHTATTRDFGITALRWAALEAGLGTIRRNNFFYTVSGSWGYLEAWLIDREMELIDKTTLKECPANCNLCRKHCPTSSLSEPYTTNMLTCVSYLTTLGGWDLQNETLSKAMGGWVFGCDACQDVCPFNQGTWTDEEDFPGLQDLSNSISLEKIINMDYQFLQESMQPKFWYIAKDNVWKWKVNALNCMLNTYRNIYSRYIEIACNDENEHVREMAEWVKEKVQSTKAL